MDLWMAWLQCVWSLRAACSRRRTFLWMVVVMAGMSTRSDRTGVTSFMRSHWLQDRAYLRLLHFFHSDAVKLDTLTRLWAQLAVRLFGRFLVRVNGRAVLIGDGIKVAKEGRKMPAVKLLHQESGCNSKAEYIMGHSAQALSLLVEGVVVFFAVPLASRNALDSRSPHDHVGGELGTRQLLTQRRKLPRNAAWTRIHPEYG